MPVEAPVQRVIDAYQLRSDRLRQQLVRYLTATWGALDDYRAADIESLVAAVVPAVEGALGQMAMMTDAYLAAIETLETGERTSPVGVDNPTTEALRGTPADEVYTRPGITVWTALSQGNEFPQAWQQGLDRLTSLGTTDLQLAKTHTSKQILGGNNHVGGYRRVLEGPQSCGLCVLASTRRYHRGDLMPIHPGCDCGVLPIYGADPGEVVDEETLAAIHERVAERFGDPTGDYRDLVVVHEHGELGPLLTRKGDEFTGPNDL